MNFDQINEIAYISDMLKSPFNYDDNMGNDYSISDDQINYKDSPDMFNDNYLDKNFPSPIPFDQQSTGPITVKNSNQSPNKYQKETNNLNMILNNDEKIIDENEKFIQKKRQRTKNNNVLNAEKKKCGRKVKESSDIGDHTKNSDDNMITKIKIYIMNSILVLLNNSFIHLNYNYTSSLNKKFLKIDPKIYTTNKKDENIKILDLAIKELLSNNISTKNSTVDKNHNINLINKIFDDQKETDIINILNLTFQEFLNLFRDTISNELEKKLSLINNIKQKFIGMENFLEKVKEQEIQKGEKEENINNYIQQLRNLCINYENWFNNKKSRKSGKKEK